MPCIFHPQENPLGAGKWARLQPNSLARLQERPRLNWPSRQGNGSDGRDFGLINRLRPIRWSYEPHNARGHQDGKTLVRVEITKDVSREKRHIYFGYTVDSLALGPIKRGESNVALSPKPAFDNLFVP
jgi:hypothetical protein